MSTQLGFQAPGATQRWGARTQSVKASVAGCAPRLTGSKAALAGVRVRPSNQAPRATVQRLVAATAAPIAPDATAPTTVDENAILDTVIVGAGVSGLTTAMVGLSAICPAFRTALPL
jgi:hypothetical protein